MLTEAFTPIQWTCAYEAKLNNNKKSEVSIDKKRTRKAGSRNTGLPHVCIPWPGITNLRGTTHRTPQQQQSENKSAVGDATPLRTTNEKRRFK